MLVTKYGKYLIITSIVIFKELAYIHTAECGTMQEIQPAQNIEEVLHNLDIQDLIIVGEHLGFNNQHFFDEVINNNNNHDVVTSNDTGVHREAIIIFILGTFALFMIAHYGKDILNLLFDLSVNTVPEIIQQNTRGLLQYAINTGHENATRAYLAHHAQTLLNDPDTTPRIVNALRVVNQRI
jgi:hypothetical protein